MKWTVCEGLLFSSRKIVENKVIVALSTRTLQVVIASLNEKSTEDSSSKKARGDKAVTLN